VTIARNWVEAPLEEINKTVLPALFKILRPDVLDKFDSIEKNKALAHNLFC
jgi:hypothetical protein